MKKLFSRILCLALTLIMVLSMAACGQDNKETTKANDDKTTVADNDQTTGEQTTEEPTTEEPREAVELTWYVRRDEMPGTAETLEALNKYLSEKLNTTLDIRFVGGEFTTKVPTLIDGGGDWDFVMVNHGIDFKTYAERNAFADITDLVEEYLPGTIAQVSGDPFYKFTKDGKIYGLPVLKDTFTRDGWTINQTMLDDLGVKFPENYATHWDLVDFLYEVKTKRDAKYPDKASNPFIQYAMYNTNQWYSMESMLGSTDAPMIAANISDKYGFSGYATDGSEVFCVVYTDEYRELMKQARALVKDGIASFDPKNFDPDKVLYSAGDLLGVSGYGTIAVSEDANDPYYKTKFYPSSLCYAGDITYGFAINADCEYVDRALEVIEVLQNDTYAATTLHFGPEGKGWTDTDNDGVIEFTPQNSDSSNRYMYHWYGWQLGGVTALKVIPGTPADLMDQMKDLNGNSDPKPNRGFIFDTTGFENELAACNNVFKEYHYMLSYGQNDNVDQLVDEFVAKLKANGMDKLVEECQKQLTEWRAANGK